MPVDNYKVAIALTEKIKEYLPITAQLTKNLSKMLRQKETSLGTEETVVIEAVFYMGDEGGISCAIESHEESQEVHVVSITHLVIDPAHPLASEIQAYQRQRIRALKLQNSRGFMAEMSRLSQQSGQKKKKGDREFGK